MSMAIPKTTQYTIGGLASAAFAFAVTFALMALGLPWMAIGFLIVLVILVLIWASINEETPEGGSS